MGTKELLNAECKNVIAVGKRKACDLSAFTVPCIGKPTQSTSDASPWVWCISVNVDTILLTFNKCEFQCGCVFSVSVESSV